MTPRTDLAGAPPRTAFAGAVTRRGQEGFTLIELTVSLVAGLIVALGILGLSRDATHTFHEEMRSSVAEANLRTGIDRLRADLGRAGYMSTGNVLQDPMIAKAPGGPAVKLAYKGLAGLASLTLNQGGSLAATPLSAKQAPTPLNPDQLDIAGNMTSTDQYEISVIQPTGGGCGGQRIFLDGTSPSMYRVLGLGTAGPQELNNIFQPTSSGTGQFAIRVVDKTGFAQFVALCPANPTGVDGGGTQPWLDIDPNTPVLMASQTGTVGGLNGYGTGALVNPVQIVRWELRAATAEPVQYSGSTLAGKPLTPTSADATKYDLLRSYVDIQLGSVIDATTEIVAEYVVDFSVSFTVDRGSGLQPNIVTYAFDDAVNPRQWAPDMTISPPLLGVGAQRIRSVRVRLATRASEGDRTFDVPVLNAGTEPYLYRYCLLITGCTAANTTNALEFARVRTVTTEVAMVNQARSY